MLGIIRLLKYYYVYFNVQVYYLHDKMSMYLNIQKKNINFIN